MAVCPILNVQRCIRTEEFEVYGDTLSNTHVREVREINNGQIFKISVILAKDI